MDPLTRLPLECLQRILQFIKRDKNKVSLGTLIALLRVNRYIASVVLPFLYRDPFNGHGTNTPIIKPLLTQTLLSCDKYCRTLPPMTSDSTSSISIHPFLAMRLKQFLPSPISTSSASTQFDYLSHVRHINQARCGTGKYGFWPANDSLSTEESAYIEEHSDEVELQCQLDDVTVAPDFAKLFHGKWRLFYFHDLSLLRETTWALANPILDQLESLTVPLSDIRRYQRVVDRLGRLESICFLQDEIYQCGDTIDEGPRIRREKAMRAMVEFVEAHARKFPGGLKDVNLETTMSSLGFHVYYPDEIRLQVYRALSPPTKLTILDQNNYLPILAHPQTVDLGHVEQIVQTQNGFSWLEKAIHAEPRFLQKCRRLKTIRMYSLGNGIFDWAVMERRSIDETGFIAMEGMDASYNKHGQGVLSWKAEGSREQQQERRSLVPLESINLYQTTYDREIDDIAFAFSRTLRNLTVGVFHCIRNIPLMEAIITPEGPVFPTCHIGRGWLDMRLKTLHINGDGTRLVLDPVLFTQCPDLVSVDLSDSTTEYRCHKISVSFPAQLGSLEKLKLQGLPALSFHPATLESTTKLKTLILSVKAASLTSSPFIPPVEELDSFYGGDGGGGGGGPLWTWDWHLPQLTELKLTGEFAYRFKFRMLRGCPTLQGLVLNITNVTDSDDHVRLLTLHDFCTTDDITTTNTDTIPHNQTPTHIVLKSLHRLTISGTWIFDDSVLPLFLHELCPNICSVSLLGCSGFSLQTVAHTLRTPSRLFQALLLSYSAPSVEEQGQLGMYSRRDWVLDMREVWNFRVQFQGEQFFLLRDLEVFSGLKQGRPR